jgi:hypothetical protein
MRVAAPREHAQPELTCARRAVLAAQHAKDTVFDHSSEGIFDLLP